MKHKAARLITFAVGAIFALSSPMAFAQQAQIIPPSYVDPEHGYLYFMIHNAGARQINNVFGWVYGTGSDERPGTHLINDPHAQALKVSLGRHVPGSLGLYQFAVSPDDLIFDSYALVVRDKALRHPARVDMQVQRVTQ